MIQRKKGRRSTLIYIYIYISLVTGLTKIRKITDYGFFEPSKVSRCPLHADHFGINGIEMREHEKRKLRISGSDPDVILKLLRIENPDRTRYSCGIFDPIAYRMLSGLSRIICDFYVYFIPWYIICSLN